MPINLVITNAGRAALVNAANTGTLPVTITQIGVASVFTAPVQTLSALPSELKRLSAIAGQVVADDTLHVSMKDESADAYALRSIALYLGDGTLFACAGQSDPMLNKAASAVALAAFDIAFDDIDAASIAFGDADFMFPMATTEVIGVVELATPAEALTGTDAQRVLTPAAAAAVYAPKASPAFTGNPTAPTPALGDNDTSLATSAFVARALTINPGFVQFSSSGSLTAADAGKTVVLGGSGGTLTLPLGSEMLDGGEYSMMVQGGTWTIQSAGGDVIAIGSRVNSSSVTSFGLFGSDYCTLSWRAAGAWLVTSGTPMLANPGGILSSKAPMPILGAGVGQWQPIGIATNLLYLPAGGTWAYWCSNNGSGFTGIAAGTTAIFSGVLNNAFGFCWRIA